MNAIRETGAAFWRKSCHGLLPKTFPPTDAENVADGADQWGPRPYFQANRLKSAHSLFRDGECRLRNHLYL
jgi:hypothetical protein